MTDPIQTAGYRFAQGFNCSQAVFTAYAFQLGIDEETALKLASPFGGGVAHHRSCREHAGVRRQGEICGAVSGTLMALGLARGNTTPEKKDETYRIAEEFIERFQELHESILCRELIGLDISTPDGLQNGKESGVFKSICPGLVKDGQNSLQSFWMGTINFSR